MCHRQTQLECIRASINDTNNNPDAATVEMMNGAKSEIATAGADTDACNMDGANANQPAPKLYPKGWKLHTLTAG